MFCDWSMDHCIKNLHYLRLFAKISVNARRTLTCGGKCAVNLQFLGGGAISFLFAGDVLIMETERQG